MAVQSTTITRAQLYALVWSRPMREIAPELNLSDVGLAKICTRLEVPRPPQGYWLRHKNGKPTQIPLLPDASAGTPHQAIIQKHEPITESPTLNVEMPEISTLKKSHPLIVQCREQRKGAGTNNFGRIAIPGRKDVDVSRTCFTRAMSLLNTIIHSTEALGHRASFSTEHKAIELVIDGLSMRISMYEPATRSEHVLSKKEMQDKEHYGTLWHQRWDYQPGGKLKFSVSAFGLYGLRTQWSDGKQTPLEGQLPKILQGLLTAADRLKEKRKEDKQREIHYEKQQRRNRRLKRAQTLQADRIQTVEQWVEGRQKAIAIRECLDAIESSAHFKQFSAPRLRQHRWARILAQHHDPCDPFELNPHQ